MYLKSKRTYTKYGHELEIYTVLCICRIYPIYGKHD